MKVSRAELAVRAEQRRVQAQLARRTCRNAELALLIAASLAAGAALGLVYAAKRAGIGEQEKTTIDLNTLTGPQQLIPLLKFLPSDAEQNFVANRIYDLKRHGVRFENVGAVARMRVMEVDRPAGARRRAASRSVPLLTGRQFAELKPALRVRDFSRFRAQFVIWVVLFFVAFYSVHLFWRARQFAGDNLFLPVMHALCGIGLALMISLRDPLRDTLMFTEFAQGVVAGCAALAFFSLPDYERRFSRISYVPLLAAVTLAIALGVFGSGPAGSDAKVNLLFFQPVELIRILIVFFLAGYFAQNWDALRQLREERGSLAKWSRRISIPRIDYLLPVVIGVAVAIALFFWLGDLGPALVLGCLFLTMYAIARNHALLAAAGLAAIIASFAIGYAIGYPRTVSDRVSMWLSPWDNHARGGDQVADSLWSLSTGGVTGTGLGLGDPQLIPAAHTDLVISAFGEEAGFLGILALYVLYAVLIYRAIRVALHAPGTYSFFLALGLTLVSAYQLLLISGGLLGLIPLSGVVSPFLSYGRTSMVANFALFGIIVSVSSGIERRDWQLHFRAAVTALSPMLALAAIIVIARFGWVQIARADQILVRGSLVMQADGVRRYVYNPRLLEVARQLPKGTIYDRNGLPLATSDWSQIEKHRTEYEKLGVAVDRTTSKLDRRQYPLGGAMFYLLGDVRTRLKQGATNTSFQESASRVRLQGYDDVAEVEQERDAETGQVTARVKRDYSALVPLLRHRYEPDHPAVKELLERPRDVRMSISAALQLRASAILARHLARLGKQKGAIVVMDPTNGDLLAAVSYPWPDAQQFEVLRASPEAPLPSEDLLDRARYGLYPPGSAFKVVTAMAALAKDPSLAQRRFECIRLPDGRVGNFVWKRAIRDDIRDTQPHGSVDMQKGLIVSCNAYFAQLGAEAVGASALYETASKLGISVAQPNTARSLQQYLPQASYGQGQVVASPFQMARVAATIANGGAAPQGRWVIDETNPRVRAPQPIIDPSLAAEIGRFMRGVVTSGTGRSLSGSAIPIAGKTGTAELAKAPSHAWFIGFAPYGGGSRKQIAFAVLVENGRYGGTAAAPIAGEVVAAAREAGLI
ncbi:MAG TPA: FtsW/RodA/SpoVE family cell cycle protein [Bryobacteraceae bacterium]|nr:FtsW/RodA/SpoVE family cell cycle protein [Bryobacteraceae bacterium]